MSRSSIENGHNASALETNRQVIFAQLSVSGMFFFSSIQNEALRDYRAQFFTDFQIFHWQKNRFQFHSAHHG